MNGPGTGAGFIRLGSSFVPWIPHSKYIYIEREVNTLHMNPPDRACEELHVRGTAGSNEMTKMFDVRPGNPS